MLLSSSKPIKCPSQHFLTCPLGTNEFHWFLPLTVYKKNTVNGSSWRLTSLKKKQQQCAHCSWTLFQTDYLHFIFYHLLPFWSSVDRNSTCSWCLLVFLHYNIQICYNSFIALIFVQCHKSISVQCQAAVNETQQAFIFEMSISDGS